MGGDARSMSCRGRAPVSGQLSVVSCWGSLSIGQWGEWFDRGQSGRAGVLARLWMAAATRGTQQLEAALVPAGLALQP